MAEFVGEIKNKIKNRYGSIPDRCFILGNGPSLKKMDLDILKDEITIACNSFMEGMAEKDKLFVPTVICGGDGSMLRDQIRQDFQYDDKGTYSKTKEQIIYIYHPGALIRNCYEIKKWTTLCPHTNTHNTNVYSCSCPYTKPIDITNLERLINDSGNMYMIEDFTTFKLNKSIKALIGSDKMANQIFTNYTYCYRYSNVIPMISLLIAKEIGFKYIYLIGCDGHKFDVHFYDKFTGRSSIDTQSDAFKNRYYGGVYKGMLERKNELDALDITMTSCYETAYDFIQSYDIDEFIKKNGKDNIINKYHSFVTNSFAIHDIDNIRNIKNSIDKNCIYTDSCLIIGDNINIESIDIQAFFQCPIIISSKIAKKFIERYPNIIPTIIYSDDLETINTDINEWFNNSQFKSICNNTYFIYNILHLFFECYDLEKNIYKNKEKIECLQTYMKNISNMFIVHNIENMAITKSIDILKNKKIAKDNLANSVRYNSIKSILGIQIALRLGMKNIFLIGCDVDITLDIKKVTNSNTYFCFLQTKHSKSTNTNTNIGTINLDRLIIEKKDIIKSLINYSEISKIKDNKEMCLIINALESILTGRNDSKLHDYIYIKHRITK